jgi:hypothetical protein
VDPRGSLCPLIGAEKFVAVAGGVAHGWRDAQALVILAEPVQFCIRGVRGLGEGGEAVEQKSQFAADRVLGPGHRAPAVPGQHFDVAERGGVAHEVGGDPPVACLIGHGKPEHGWVGRAGPVCRPGPAAGEEAVAWHVRDVEIDSEPVALLVVDLRVEEDPSLPGGVPVLADPVVFELPGTEVAAEAAFWGQWSQEFQASRSRLPVRIRASAQALAVFPEIFGDTVREALSAALPPDEHGWQEVTLSFEHAKAAAHRLAGFGAQVEVLSPPTVRQHLLATAEGILSRYGMSTAAEPPH